MDIKLLSALAISFGSLIWLVYIFRIIIYPRSPNRSQLSKIFNAIALITGMAAIIVGSMCLN